MTVKTIFKYDVFISYSSRNKSWVVDNLLKGIEESGLKAFIDYRDFRRGAPSISEMERGVILSRKTILVLTPEYIDSEWCEIETIMLQTVSPANRDLRLIPLLRAPCKKPLRLSALTHVDFTENADTELAWSQLLSALEAAPKTLKTFKIPPDIQAELDAAKNLTCCDKHFEAIPILERALQLADNINHPKAKAKVRIRLAGAIYSARDDYERAEKCYRDALVLVPVRNRELTQSVLQGLGDMLLGAGRIDEANATISESVALATETGNEFDIATAIMSKGLIQQTLGLHESAIANLENASNLFLRHGLSLKGEDKKRNDSALATCYLNRAIVCKSNGDLEQALSFCNKAKTQYEVSEDKLYSGRAFLFRGELYCSNADWDNAFQDYRQALEIFTQLSNPIWIARASDKLAELYAKHEDQEKALQLVLLAVSGAAESEHYGEQVQYLCTAAKQLRGIKMRAGKDELFLEIKRHAELLPKNEQAEFYAKSTAQLDSQTEELQKEIREDSEASQFLDVAMQIAKQHDLHMHFANCLLDKAYHQSNDIEDQKELINQAVDSLKEASRNAQSPKHKGRLASRISVLYGDLENHAEAMSWLRRSGEIFDKSGDLHGLADFHSHLGENQISRGELDVGIRTYRDAIEMIEGRSFHSLAAELRIKLAFALRYKEEYGEAKRLLDVAEAICKKHKFNGPISSIAHCRSQIESELQAAQAPSQTLSDLLQRLEQLIQYRPDKSLEYLSFWFFTFKTELLAVFRSSPSVSFMVVTDDVDRLFNFAKGFSTLGDHFLMASSDEPTVFITPNTIEIPPDWLFPPTFSFIFMKVPKTSPEVLQDEHGDTIIGVPRINMDGPASTLPLYMPVEKTSDGNEGGFDMMALAASVLPQSAIDVMLGRPISELTALNAIWMPFPSNLTKDPFLTQLRVSHERGLIPVYFESLPASNAVAHRAGVQVTIPQELLDGGFPVVAEKWRRSLIKLTKLLSDQAQLALLDLPDLFEIPNLTDNKGTIVNVALMEFREIGKKVLHPVILV